MYMISFHVYDFMDHVYDPFKRNCIVRRGKKNKQKIKVLTTESKMSRWGKPVWETDKVKNREGCRKRGSLIALGAEKERHWILVSQILYPSLRDSPLLCFLFLEYQQLIDTRLSQGVEGVRAETYWNNEFLSELKAYLNSRKVRGWTTDMALTQKQLEPQIQIPPDTLV